MNSEIMGDMTPCLCGAESGSVRKDKNGKLFVLCECGQHFMRTARGQDMILSRAEIYGAAKRKEVTDVPTGPEPPPPRQPQPEPDTGAKAVSDNVPKPKRAGTFFA
ncbi:MAG TPA: hypothetical protein VFX47_02920 [Gammaproteobacteria bacterium]|nr:hypothetical protein [Gammaproteobacteria bacterium]